MGFFLGVKLSGQKVRDRWTYFQQKGDIWNLHEIADLLTPNFSFFFLSLQPHKILIFRRENNFFLSFVIA